MVFTWMSLIALYQARWEVENYYRDEKQWLSVEDFMSKSVLGVNQELFATVVMSLITRVSLYLEDQKVENEKREGVPQFYNAITAISKAIPRMIALGIDRCKLFFSNLLASIVKTRYAPKEEFRSFARISRKPQNKWKTMALKQLAALK